MHIADLFIEKIYRDKFAKQGYVVLPLLEKKEVDALLQFYEQIKSSAGVEKPFYTSIWSDDKAHRQTVNDTVNRILFPALQKKLLAIQPVFANFMVKGSGDNSALIPHQDWSFVEEPKHDSATVWCPLIDVNKTNGNLQVIPGSHLLNNYVRPRFADAPFREIEKAELKKLLVDIPMKAGEAIILNSRMIHASPNNTSNKHRIVASVVLAPQEATLFHWEYEQNDDKPLTKKYSIKDDFFYAYSCYETLSDLIPIETKSFAENLLTLEELKKIIGYNSVERKLKRALSHFLTHPTL
ncbi:MAG: phytanoyl-CoA dioxygenase family protein [Bacteroidetes bacterium]|nr:phytanoyl-CoA dioxygenase family protein [Bacteroidota bacterium]